MKTAIPAIQHGMLNSLIRPFTGTNCTPLSKDGVASSTVDSLRFSTHVHSNAGASETVSTELRLFFLDCLLLLRAWEGTLPVMYGHGRKMLETSKGLDPCAP